MKINRKWRSNEGKLQTGQGYGNKEKNDGNLEGVKVGEGEMREKKKSERRENEAKNERGKIEKCGWCYEGNAKPCEIKGKFNEWEKV